MKVILLQEIKGYGGEGDVVEVKRGFANNYLFPKKMAIKATSGELKQLEQRRHNIEKREAARMDDANAAVAFLESKVVVIPMKVGEEGRLFGSVTAIMIAEALKEQHDLDVDRRKIEVGAPIKELGDHEVLVNVYRELKAPINVKVVSDGEAVDIGLTAEEAGELVDAEATEPVVDGLTADEAVSQEADGETVEADIVAVEAAVAEDVPADEVFANPMPDQEEVLEEGAPVEEELVAEALDEDAAAEWTEV